MRAGFRRMTAEQLAARLQQALGVAGFEALGSIVNADKLKAMYAQQAGLNRYWVMLAQVHMDEAELERLAEAIRVVLKAYLDPETDQIGNGLYGLMYDTRTRLIPRFSESVLRAAAILGPREAADKVLKWANGLPFQYKQEAFINFSHPPNGDGIIRAEEGIEIARAATSSAEIVQKIPPLVAERVNLSRPKFHAVLRVAYNWRPVFMCVQEARQSDSWQNMEARPNQGNFPATDNMIEDLCQAMAMTMGEPVSWSFQWKNYHADGIFFAELPGPKERSIRTRKECPFPTEKDVGTALNFYKQRQEAEGKISNLKYAIERLCRSQQASTLEDQAIELRIALETLFLSGVGGSGELNFRLALHAARYIGTDGADRKKWFKVARDAYYLGSKAVHGSSLDPAEEEHNRKTITEGQQLCIEGIKKRVKEQRNPDWKEVILS